MVVDLQRLFPSASSATLGSAVASLRRASRTLGLVGIVGWLWARSSFWGAQATLAHAGAAVAFALPVLVWFYAVAAGLPAGAAESRPSRAGLRLAGVGERNGIVGLAAR